MLLLAKPDKSGNRVCLLTVSKTYLTIYRSLSRNFASMSVSQLINVVNAARPVRYRRTVSITLLIRIRTKMSRHCCLGLVGVFMPCTEGISVAKGIGG